MNLQVELARRCSMGRREEVEAEKMQERDIANGEQRAAYVPAQGRQCGEHT